MNESMDQKYTNLSDATSVDLIGANGDAEEDIDETDDIGEYVDIGAGGMNQQQERGNPHNNPKNHIITAALLLAMMLVLILTDHIKREFEAANFEGYIDVIVQEPQSDPTYAEEKVYYSIAADGEYQQIEAFEGDGAERFITGYYEHDYGAESGRMNYLLEHSIYRDDNADDKPDGEAVEMTPVFERILTLIEQTETEHYIMRARILRVGEEYFVCVDRNVNWWTPYVLYYYSAEHETLYGIFTFSGRNVVDIRMTENFEAEMNSMISAQINQKLQEKTDMEKDGSILSQPE